MGNAFSGVPRRLGELDENRLTPQQKNYLYKLKEHYKVKNINQAYIILNTQVPDYFKPPNPKQIILPPLPSKSAPNGWISKIGGPIPPGPPPSFVYLHPRADLYRRHLFLHVFSDAFAGAKVGVEKLFVRDDKGDGDGVARNAYVFVIGGIHRKGPRSAGPCSLPLDEKMEFQSMIPTLAKLRITIKTRLTTSKCHEEHERNGVPDTLSGTHEYVRIMELRAEIMGFDRNNRVVRPPGLVGVGARLFVEQEKEMGKLVEKKRWEWCVEQVREICKAIIGEDGGVWEFVGGMWEGTAVEVEGEGLVNCFIEREN